MFITNHKKALYFFVFLIITFCILYFFIINNPSTRELSWKKPKNITFNNNGILSEITTTSTSVEKFLEENHIKITPQDKIIPEKNTPIFPRLNIQFKKSAKIQIKVDGNEIENYTLQNSIHWVLKENNIIINPLDKVEPSEISPPKNNDIIIVTRINIEEKIISEKIKFKTITKNDDNLGWREEKIKQTGEQGILDVKYKIKYKNGKEISRKILEKHVAKDPVDKIIIKGTYIKFGKTHRGLGTWYRQPFHLFIGSESGKGMYAASPWLPKKSYVKVTNKANGKSIIVRINDRGPLNHEKTGKIIDLNYDAFAKIASVGAGVIDVKLEEIEN